MSDIAVGALIGLGGTLLGAIITGIISYVIAKQQINARRYEIKEQLAYQSEEARINRLIDARKEPLRQLRQTISDYTECSHQVTNATVRFKKAIDAGDSGTEKQATKEWFDELDKAKQLTSRIEILRG